MPVLKESYKTIKLHEDGESPLATLDKVVFGSLTPGQIRAQSVVKITELVSKDGSNDNTPYDERMGVIDNGHICQTCGMNNMDCQGHFGHIELPKPVYNPQFLVTVYKLLQCVCISCGGLRKLTEHINIIPQPSKPTKRFESLVKTMSKIDLCPHCDSFIPRFKYTPKDLLLQIGNDKEFVTLEAEQAYNYLSKITSETMKTLGFNRDLIQSDKYKDIINLNHDQEHTHEVLPTSFIFVALPVIPPCARPWVLRDSDMCHDDITDKYCNIIRLIKKLNQDYSHSKRKTRKELTEDEIKRAYVDIDLNVYTLLDNKNDTSKISSCGRAHKGIRDRIEHKDGHINSNVGGKRTDFSARTVIISGAGLNIGEIGVPKAIADKLTVPEYVTSLNITQLCESIVEGGPLILIRGGNRIRLDVVTKNYTKEFTLKIGDIVERKLRNGDLILFNRQPTLRTESMMGMIVVIMNDGGNAFRVPLAVCTAFNADFDGDEMNLHLPQSIAAIVECATIMAAREHLITAQRNGPVCGVIQDGLVGSYLLTNFNTEVSMSIFFDCVFSSGIELDTKEFFTRVKKYYGIDYSKSSKIPGKVFFSAIFPSSFVYKRRTDFSDEMKFVEIYEGIILPNSAPLCKKTIGAKQRSIIHDIWKEYSSETCARVISRIQRMTDNWLHIHGFSIGISDCISTKPKEINDILMKAEAVCDGIIKSEKTLTEKEGAINKELNAAMNSGPVIANHNMNRGDDNSITIMRNSGAKGNNTNCVQIAAFVGQQNIDGGRMNLSIPCFKKGDISPAAKGFVIHSYMDGLNPSELYFHSGSGRRGVVDTAMKTADSGYIEKRIMKKVEDFLVKMDGSVRSGNGEIIQFKYGDDGFNPKYLYSVKGLDYPFFVDCKSLSRRLNLGETGKKREMNDEEIELLLSFIRVKNSNGITEIDEVLQGNINYSLRKLLTGVKICETQIPKFCAMIRDSFEEARAPYGEPVGVISSQALGEPTTQLTLNTFHAAGLAEMDVTLGVPRLKELLNGTKNPSTPSVRIYLVDERLVELSKDQSKEGVRLIIDHMYEQISDIETITISKLIDNMKVMRIDESEEEQLFTYEEFAKSSWSDLFSENFGECSFEKSDWMIRLKFNIDKLYQYRITLEEIKQVMEDITDGCLYCEYSPLMIGEMDIFIDFENIKNSIKFEMNSTFSVTRDVITKFVKNMKIKGIDNLLKAIPEQDVNGEWFIHASGNNLIDIIGKDCVDIVRTNTNDIWEIYKILGIEAVRAFLIEEFTTVLSFGGTYINPRHISILVDAMTRTGVITSVTQDGISRGVGPISKGLFEKCTENFSISAAFGEVDNMQGSSANVMFGKLIKNGVGGVEVF